MNDTQLRELLTTKDFKFVIMPLFKAFDLHSYDMYFNGTDQDIQNNTAYLESDCFNRFDTKNKIIIDIATYYDKICGIIKLIDVKYNNTIAIIGQITYKNNNWSINYDTSVINDLMSKSKTRYIKIKSIIDKSIIDKSIDKSISIKHIKKPKYTKIINREKKKNKYDLSGEFGVGLCANNNKPFIFDLEDYDKIKNYTWNESIDGYIYTNLDDLTHINMSKIILGITDTEQVGIYIGGKNSRYDNRKSNLKIGDKCNRVWGKEMNSNNTSGVTGVCYDKTLDRWWALLTHNGIKERRSFKNKSDAIKQRKTWEQVFYGEFARDNRKNSK